RHRHHLTSFPYTTLFRSNAKLHGRRGLQFAWESSPLHGEEPMPVPALAAMYEDHGSLDIALAFVQFAHATGDQRFLRHQAAPVRSEEHTSELQSRVDLVC